MPEVGVATMPVLPDFKPFNAGLAAQSSGIASKFAKVGKVAALAFVGATAGAVAGLGKLGASFDDAYDTIRTGTGATGKALKGLETDFKSVLKGVPASFGDTSTAIADLNTRLGLTGKPLQDTAKQFLELSRITKTDVAGNIAAVTRVFGDWGISAADQASAMDKLFRASQATGIGVQELSQKVVQFGAPMRQFGFSFEESAALMAKWEKEGVNTEMIMGGLRIGLGKLAAAGKDPAAAFAEMTKKVKATSDAGKAATIVSELFGRKAGPELAAAIKEGRFEISDLLGVIEGGSETIIGAGKDTQDFGEKWTMIKNRVFVALEPIAMRLFDAIGRGMDNVAKFWDNTLEPAFHRLRAWWDENAPPVIARVKEVSDAILGWVRDVEPPIRSWVDNVLGSVRKWWDSNGPWITATVLALKDTLVTTFERLKEAAQTVVRNWDTIKPVIEKIALVIVTVMIPHWIALRVAAVIESARVVAAWVATHVQAIASAVVHSAQVVIMVGKWVFLGAQAIIHAATVVASWVATGAGAIAAAAVMVAQTAIQIGRWVAMGAVATAQALVIAAAWAISMGPIALVVLAIAGLAVAFVTHWSEIKNAVLTGVQTVVGAFLGLVTTFVDGAALAFGWVPGIGPKLKEAAAKVNEFRDDVNKSLEGIKDKTVTVHVNLAGDKAYTDFRAMEREFANRQGDGPGRGGKALARVQSVLPRGAYITSTYRTPEHNRRVGGSPRSFHLDKSNPAVDIGGPTRVLDALYAKLRNMGGWRELLYRVPGHFNHIHAAHGGGIVSRDWPTVPGLQSYERPAILKVGEAVLTEEQQARIGSGSGIDDALVEALKATLEKSGRQMAREYAREWVLQMRAA